MKVLLRRNISMLGRIGDVVEVKPGYARNYLLPQELAVVPSPGNLKAVEAERQQYLDQLAAQRAETEAKAEAVRGKEVTIAARANEEGHLYGSVGPAQIIAALAEEGVFLEADNIALDSPIRQLDKYDIEVVFGEDVKSMIHVWVVPIREEGQAEPPQPPVETVETSQPAESAEPDAPGEPPAE